MAAGVDRISELPESIVHQILSFLSQNQAIQTSALSKPWRHWGPTRPKIEFREDCFKKSSRPSFLSVLGKTLQRYHHQNLSVDEFILEMSSSSWDRHHHQLITDPEFTTTVHDHEQPLFKGLKRLSLHKVHIKDKTLEKIMRSCPLIEYLLVANCAGLTTIPVTIFQAEFLTELHLIGYRLIVTTTDQLLLIKRLKTLSLKVVNIAEETLEKIMCSCPLIESVLLVACVGLKNVRLNNNNNNLKHFSGSFYGVNIQSIEIYALTIQTISIEYCPNWYCHDKYFFPRLKTLYLHEVKLSAELFESFSSSFPSLEELELKYCHGLEDIPEIQLTACSIKRLVLKMFFSKNPIKATIYAPNIHYFEFYGCLPQLIFNSETGREWKSQIDIWAGKESDDKDLNFLWLLQLSKLLNSLRESQISLGVHLTHFKNLTMENTNDAVSCNPVPLEDVHVKGGYESCSFPDLLNCLFLICRPRYIRMNMFTITTVTDLKREKDKLVEFITFKKTIQNEGEMSRGYLWEQDLEEINMQFRGGNSQGWHTVGVEETSFPGLKTCDPEIMFSVKWRD